MAHVKPLNTLVQLMRTENKMKTPLKKESGGNKY